jgi:DNA-binding FadR family transcriptional regulator
MKALLQPLKTESLTEIFISRFEELILSGELSIGQKLPSERELSLQLSVSRPVVHEGLMDLAHKGLVTMKPRIGAVISDYRNDGSLALLNSLVSYRKGKLNDQLADSLIDMRGLFEVECAKLAAQNRTVENLQTLKTIVDKEQKLRIEDTSQVTELDFDFHHKVAMSTGNLVYPLIMNSFRQVYTNLSGLFFKDTSVVKQVFASHKKLFAAIKDGSEGHAVLIMKKLLKHGEKHLKALRG